MADPQEPLAPDELVIVLLGASAVGKSTIAEHLVDAGIAQATPTWATREPRHGEQDTCYDHRFVTDEEFDHQSKTGGFVDEHAFYGARYGVPFLNKPAEGKEALVVLKPVFMPLFLGYYTNARVYPIEASPILLPRRMRARGQSEEDITERMKHHTSEASAAKQFSDIPPFINNGPVKETLEKVELQIKADREAHNAKRLSRA